jgi:hypothetical protein
MRRVNSVLNVEAYRYTRSRIISSYNNETMYDTALALQLKIMQYFYDRRNGQGGMI